MDKLSDIRLVYSSGYSSGQNGYVWRETCRCTPGCTFPLFLAARGGRTLTTDAFQAAKRHADGLLVGLGQ